MSTAKKVKEYIEKEKLIKKGDKILLGLSGGADSVCLFYLLLGIKEELGFKLRAVHVHHGIRVEADEDAAYVEALCEKEGIRCFMFKEDVPAFAKAQGLSGEEAGRILRYADFDKCLRQWQEEDGEESYKGNLPCRYVIATAHHKNDQAETVLFQLFRGCGLAGLRGILPGRDNIIRPLLCLSRGEIEEFLREKGIFWREDRTNQEEDYSRNKIRHRILAYAEREINGNASAHIARTAEIVREAERYIEGQVQEAYNKTAKEQGGMVIFDIPALCREDVFIQKQLLLSAFGRILASGKDIGAVHVENVLKLAEKQGNGSLFLPDGVQVRKSYQKLVFSGKNGGERTGEEQGEKLSEVLLEEKGFLYDEQMPVIKTERIDLTKEESVKKRFALREISEILHYIPQKTYTKWFDYDKIKMPFSVRHRESGDYLTINEEMEHKSFRRYMIEHKIPVSYRNRIWLLADGSHVIWVPGGRMSAYYKVTTQTKTILQVEICRGE